MVTINFKFLNNKIESISFNYYKEVENYLKENILKISSFAIGTTEYYIVSGKELKENISVEDYYTEIKDWYLKEDNILNNSKTVPNDYYFMVYRYKTNQTKLYAVYRRSEYKSIAHDFLMNTNILKWY